MKELRIQLYDVNEEIDAVTALVEEIGAFIMREL